MAQNLITLPEAAEYLGLSVQTLRLWIDNGRIPAYRVGQKFIRVKVADIEAMIQPVPPTKDGR